MTLDVDPVRLAQVLTNLLNNAAKFTAPGGKISVTARREGPDAVISRARQWSRDFRRDAAANLRPVYAGRFRPRGLA